MSWIAEYDTQGREFPTCVHVTKTTGTMTHGATYVPIEDGKAVRAENAKLRERAVAMLSELRGVVSEGDYDSPSGRYFLLRRDVAAYEDALRELGIELDG